MGKATGRLPTHRIQRQSRQATVSGLEHLVAQSRSAQVSVDNPNRVSGVGLANGVDSPHDIDNP